MRLIERSAAYLAKPVPPALLAEAADASYRFPLRCLKAGGLRVACPPRDGRCH